MLKAIRNTAVAVSAAVAAPAAMAFTSADAEAYISGDLATGITAIGSALLVAAVTVMGFKWGKAMLFG